jgi:hypothetical protein
MAPGVFTNKPDIITIELGTNDANKAFNRTTFTRDYNHLIDTFLTISSHPRIYIVLPPPIVTPPQGYLNDTVGKAIVPVLQSIASQRGLSIIDLNTPFVGHTGWTTDGIHPNNAGNDTIAHIFYSVLSGGAVRVLSSQYQQVTNQYANGQAAKIRFSRHGMMIDKTNINDGRSRAFLLNGGKKLTP